ncbi:MAG: hypothetical protein ACUVRV_11945 [Cyanobacteriota bacterium]
MPYPTPNLEFNIIPEADPDAPRGSAIAFPKGSPHMADFNRILAEIKASGKMDELIVKWFGENSPALATE